VSAYVRFEHGGRVRHGELHEDRIQPLDGTIGAFTPSDEPPVPLADVRLRAPTSPSKIVAIGPNYRTHYAQGGTPPDAPMLWFKSPTGVNDPEGTIELPPGHIVNHESELAIVIGRRAKNVDEARAGEHIFGYTCMNDVTAGDFSEPGAFAASHYFVDGKIFDTFAPLGPVIATGLDVADLQLECRVNGEVRQRARTSDFLFSPRFLVSMVSRVLTLEPGDVISTGSPPGVAPLQDGDTVEIEIEGIGVLRNHARAAGH
jgi:2-keto-4-pentenoate hydratase/2-oxohepta-3-ene-1,7-dioic acid hydratase in catechol pathway